MKNTPTEVISNSIENNAGLCRTSRRPAVALHQPPVWSLMPQHVLSVKKPCYTFLLNLNPTTYGFDGAKGDVPEDIYRTPPIFWGLVSSSWIIANDALFVN